MYYNFDLKLDLINNEGQTVLSADVTGKSIAFIRASIAACPYSIVSGGLTASLDDSVLDGVSLKSLNEMTYTDFVNWVLDTEKEAQNLQYAEMQAA